MFTRTAKPKAAYLGLSEPRTGAAESGEEEMNVLDLFSGIGGFSLGLERAGMHTVAFCEIDPYCRAVLKKHWPDVPIYDDVRTLTAGSLAADGIAVDVICGGFPCQDISNAGKRSGIEGERSGLWSEYARIIGESRPRYVIVENVAALLGRGLNRVLGDLAALGFDAEWHCIPASAVGAPHRRDRVWIIASDAGGKQHEGAGAAHEWTAAAGLPEADLADTDCGRWTTRDGNIPAAGYGSAAAASRGDGLCDANSARLALRQSLSRDHVEEFAAAVGADWWLSEPDVGRMAHGIPSRVDRLRALGNAVVPQIPEMIGRAIMMAEHPANELANSPANGHHDVNEFNGLQTPAIIAQKD